MVLLIDTDPRCAAFASRGDVASDRRWDCPVGRYVATLERPAVITEPTPRGVAQRQVEADKSTLPRPALRHSDSPPRWPQKSDPPVTKTPEPVSSHLFFSSREESAKRRS